MAETKNEIVLLTPSGAALPAQVAAVGAKASRRFVEFFTTNISNKITREAYRRNITAFLAWCDNEARLALDLRTNGSSPPMSRSYSKMDCRSQPSNSTWPRSACCSKANKSSKTGDLLPNLSLPFRSELRFLLIIFLRALNNVGCLFRPSTSNGLPFGI
jgi:hypothetical protein